MPRIVAVTSARSELWRTQQSKPASNALLKALRSEMENMQPLQRKKLNWGISISESRRHENDFLTFTIRFPICAVPLYTAPNNRRRDRRVMRLLLSVVSCVAVLTPCARAQEESRAIAAANLFDNSAGVEEGRSLFQLHCSYCHGARGEGGQAPTSRPANTAAVAPTRICIPRSATASAPRCRPSARPTTKSGRWSPL